MFSALIGFLCISIAYIVPPPSHALPVHHENMSAPLNTYQKAVAHPLPKTHFMLKSGMTIPATLFYTQDFDDIPSRIEVSTNNAVLNPLTNEEILPKGAYFSGNFHFSLVDGEAFIFIVWNELAFPAIDEYMKPYSVKLAPDNITDVLSIFHKAPFVSIIKAKRCAHQAKLCLPENALMDVRLQNDFDLKLPPTQSIEITEHLKKHKQ